ncbi:hypothetical protein M5689_008911 [Euphorbia peplus]|nr:hypothetical protein M5689_008911 [Euphorbia peplus]
MKSLKSLQMFMILIMLVLLMINKESSSVADAVNTKVCVVGEKIEKCTEKGCNDLCLAKHGDSRGYCVVVGVCSCIFPCGPP